MIKLSRVLSSSSTISHNQEREKDGPPSGKTGRVSTWEKMPRPFSRRRDQHFAEVSARTQATEPFKTVSFDDNVTTRFVLSLSGGYSRDEIEACWFSSDECMKIAKQCAKQIRRLDRGQQLRDKKYCERGLEGHTNTGYALKVLTRSESIKKVLEEQERQQKEGVFDDDALARAYRDVTSSAQLWARSLALRDEREAEACSLDYEELDRCTNIPGEESIKSEVS